MEIKQVFPGIYSIEGRLATRNLVRGQPVYGERIVKMENGEYRQWDLFRSKLAGAIKKGLKEVPIKPGSKVLYLGASTGTTPSHVSDIIGEKGEVYCVEISPHCMKNLMQVAEKRGNMIPILGDARRPDDYKEVGTVDTIYMDVAQKDQDYILKKNAAMFLKSGSFAMIAVKSQSIDVTRKPDEVFAEFKGSIAESFEVVQELKLEPYDKDHLFLLLRKK